VLRRSLAPSQLTIYQSSTLKKISRNEEDYRIVKPDCLHGQIHKSAEPLSDKHFKWRKAIQTQNYIELFSFLLAVVGIYNR
jgi:hypothetical protein